MRRTFALCVAAILLGTAGCSESTPPPRRDDTNLYPPPLDAASFDAADADAADGPLVDGGATADADAEAWAGTWAFVSGSQGFMCGGNLGVVAVSGFLDITPSLSGTMLSVKEDGCSFHFDLAGNVATAAPGQLCAAWAEPSIPLWTLTMQPDGTLREKLGGNVVVSGEVCTISGGSTLVRQ